MPFHFRENTFLFSRKCVKFEIWKALKFCKNVQKFPHSGDKFYLYYKFKDQPFLSVMSSYKMFGMEMKIKSLNQTWKLCLRGIKFSTSFIIFFFKLTAGVLMKNFESSSNIIDMQWDLAIIFFFHFLHIGDIAILLSIKKNDSNEKECMHNEEGN